MVNKDEWQKLFKELSEKGVSLVAVSKKKSAEEIKQLYELGQRDFGENYVQELVEKHAQLPGDIKWHFIGHLQGNKVKNIAPFIHLVHTVDSLKLLAEINKQALRCGRVIDVLLQMHIAEEETKFGMDESEINTFLSEYVLQKEQLMNVRICGLMGMATNTDNYRQVRTEFARAHAFFTHLKNTFFINDAYFSGCSMGMSSDYPIAIEEGSTIVRIGSLLFGERVN